MALLDEVIKAGKEMESFDRNKKTLQIKIDDMTKQLIDVKSEAESAGRKIIQDAKNEASKIIKAAEDTLGDVKVKEAEVIAREKAVEWVKDEDEKLKARAKSCTDREKQTEKSKIEYITQKDFYVEKCKEVDTTINALMEREKIIASKEQSLRIGVTKEPSPAKKKVTKKKAK